MNEARKVGRGKSKGVARLITTATRMWRMDGEEEEEEW